MAVPWGLLASVPSSSLRFATTQHCWHQLVHMSQGSSSQAGTLTDLILAVACLWLQSEARSAQDPPATGLGG